MAFCRIANPASGKMRCNRRNAPFTRLKAGAMDRISTTDFCGLGGTQGVLKLNPMQFMAQEARTPWLLGDLGWRRSQLLLKHRGRDGQGQILPSLSEGKTEPPTTKISSPKPSNRMSWLQNYGEIVVCCSSL